MKFGKLEQPELSKVSFDLPDDHPDNSYILKAANSDADPEIFVGCAKWGVNEWNGLLYPQGTKPSNFLDEYVNHFNTIELNTTFYSLKKDHIHAWKEKAKPGFKFCPKVNRRISHTKRLILNDDYFDYFITTTALLEEHLGTSFLQMPENFSDKYEDRLIDFLEWLPEDYPLALELRHESWFESEKMDKVFYKLRETNKSGVITDVAGRRDVLHMRLSKPEVFIRFNGYGFDEITRDRIDQWVDRLKQWIDLGLQRCYFIPHQHDETKTPLTCQYFIEKINGKCGLNLKAPRLIS